jgi:glutamate 5-kinase
MKTGGLKYRRIVVKFGTSLLSGGGDQLDETVMGGLVAQLAQLHDRGAKTVIVSSGAIAAGRHHLGMTRKVKGIPYKQVLASVGQGRLMQVYDRLFADHGITVAQALLTKTDLADRAGYLNARNTLLALLDMGVVGVVNENDVVAIDEIKEEKFGDNDILSAMVTNLVDADLLMILTDIGGLYTADPRRDAEATLIPKVDRIDASILQLVTDATSKLGTGGMITKVEAARLATSYGANVVIADGREKDVILRLASGEAAGTRFPPTASRRESRKRWMLSGLCTRGKLVVDAGAALALRKQNRSLLAAGVSAVEGKFDRGDIVAVHDSEGGHLGCGISNYSAKDLGAIKGLKSAAIGAKLGYDYGPEVVHRNNLALLEGDEAIEHRQTLQLQR